MTSSTQYASISKIECKLINLQYGYIETNEECTLCEYICCFCYFGCVNNEFLFLHISIIATKTILIDKIYFFSSANNMKQVQRSMPIKFTYILTKNNDTCCSQKV